MDVRPALRTLLRLMSSARRAVVDAESDAAGDGSCEEDVVTSSDARRRARGAQPSRARRAARWRVRNGSAVC